MVVSRLLKFQTAEKRKELVSELQKEASALYYDRMMYDINDSLTSILAVCDVEGKDGIPKIKQYIHRINQSLNATKDYQGKALAEKKFNITLVLRNLIRVVEQRYKDAKLVCLVTDIKASVLGEQVLFEQLILQILVLMFSEPRGSESEILLELRQKDQNALITILKDNHTFSDEVLKPIREITESDDYHGEFRITPQGKGVEVIIKIPLQFNLVAAQQLPPTNTQKTRQPRQVAAATQGNAWNRITGKLNSGFAF
jgi:hypothetical protein